MLPDFEQRRADRRVLQLSAEPHLRRQLTNCEKDRTLRPVLVGTLREARLTR